MSAFGAPKGAIRIAELEGYSSSQKGSQERCNTYIH